LLQITTNVAQAAMIMPHVKWKEILGVVGDALNVPHLADMIDLQPQQQQQQQGGPPMGGGGGMPQGQSRTNAMGEPNPVPASSVAGMAAAANRV
jgi:hypothetical protein